VNTVDEETVQRVKVVDLDMPFGSLVALMVKWAFAAIPAMIIVAVVGFLLAVFVSALGANLPGFPVP